MSHSEIEIDANNKSISQLHDWALSILKEIQVRPKKAKQLMLCLEEVVVNIIKHGYAEKPGKIHVTLDHDDHTISATIKDWAFAYNPLERKDFPADETTLEEKEVGGLGLLFVHNLTDDATYERKDDTNVLVLEMKKI